jgi:hypothetical protein
MNVQDPELEAQRRPAWRLDLVDLDGPFGWGKAGRAELLTIFERLKSFESMSWREIDQSPSCHLVPLDRISKPARDRLESLKLEDTDGLYQLRIQAKVRVFGFRDRNILRILWWDDDHQVWPVALKHT